MLRDHRSHATGATQRRGHDGPVKQGEQEGFHARDSVGQTSGATQRGLNLGCSERIGNSRRTGDDATTLDLLTAVEGPLVRVTADAAYDTVAVLRNGGGAGCDSRHPTGQDGDRLWARPAVVRAGSDDHVGEAARPAPVEEGVRVPSSGPGGEHVLPLQVHHRRRPSRPSPAGQGSEILNRMTALGRPESYRIGR